MNLIDEIKKFPSSRQEEAINLAIAKLGRQSLYVLCKYLLGFKDVNPRTHSSMIQNLSCDTKRKLIVMPRGTLKTTIAAVGYPIQQVLKNPNIRILLDSEVYQNSKNLLREIKDHLRKPHMEELYGRFYNDSCWNEGEIIVRQRTVVKKEATITCSGIGAQKTGQHYDLIIGDDLNSPKNSQTAENRQKVIDHYRMYTSLLEPEGTIVLIGTRYSDGDNIGNVLSTEVFPVEEDVA